jgi:DNA modification methylase
MIDVQIGDAKVIAKQIPDESVDIILTDPVYMNLQDYEWLSETAARVLKPDRACLAWYGGSEIEKVKKVMSQYLTYTWQLYYTVPAKSHRLIGYNIFTWTTQCLWFRKGKGFPVNRIPDTFISHKRPDGNFKWNKNKAVLAYWLRAFLPDGGTVFDPFAGEGVMAVVCKELGVYDYFGCEIDRDTALKAWERIRLAQPALRLKLPEQQPLTMGT